MKKLKLNRRTLDRWPKWTVGYGPKLKVKIPYPENPREGICDACGRSKADGSINVTHLHHWLYKYKHDTIRKDPLKVLENVNEFCFTDHKIADAFRGLFAPNGHMRKEDTLWRVVKTGILMPEEMKEYMDQISRMWLKKRESDKTRKAKMDFYVG